MKTNKRFDFSQITFNAGLLVKELMKRGIAVEYVGKSEIVSAALGNHKELLYDIHTSLVPYTYGWIINDKFYTKHWLTSHGFSVAKGQAFSVDNVNEALEFAKTLKFPVVLKPTTASHGDGVWLNIQKIDDLHNKILAFQDEDYHSGYMLIEEYNPAKEYRLIITKNDFFAAVHRIPASITGDGKHTIQELVEKENYRRMNPRINCLCTINLDPITFDFLARQSLTINYIPKKNEEVFLRENSNVSTGGNCIDVTNSIHTSVKKLAKDILNTFDDLPYISIDLLCNDVSKPLNNYIICELNSAPGLSLHMLPGEGTSRNVAGALADLLFPETYHATP